jgi:hypothetical protein
VVDVYIDRYGCDRFRERVRREYENIFRISRLDIAFVDVIFSVFSMSREFI